MSEPTISSSLKQSVLSFISGLKSENDALKREFAGGGGNHHLAWVARAWGSNVQLISDLFGAIYSQKGIAEVMQAAAAANNAFADYGESHTSADEQHRLTSQALEKLEKAIENLPTD